MVCLSVTIVSPAKTAEPIEMSFCVWTGVGQRKRVLDRGPDPHTKMGNFEGEWPIQGVPGHVRRSIYSKRLNRG